MSPVSSFIHGRFVRHPFLENIIRVQDKMRFLTHVCARRDLRFIGVWVCDVCDVFSFDGWRSGKQLVRTLPRTLQRNSLRLLMGWNRSIY